MGRCTCLHLFDLEATLADKNGDASCYVATLKCPVKERLRPLLPALNCTIRRETMLEKDQLAIGLQNSSDTLDRRHYSRNRAKRKGISRAEGPT